MANDGGPAFPRIDGIEEGDHGRQHVVSTDGMSLRDWFAGQALAGLVTLSPRGAEQLSNPEGRTYEEWMADEAYGLADAMLAGREKDRA